MFFIISQIFFLCYGFSMIDLHIHTLFSDGQYTPAEFIKKVADKNIEVIAITDHDTVDGLEEGEFEAKKYGITFVRGIELNIERPNCECHLLGLGLQEISPELKKIISSLQKSRNERNEQMISLMNAGGIEITMEDLQNEFSCHVLGRPHFAAWLEKHGIVKHRQDAFDKYLARGRPWFVERVGADLDDSIEAIYKSGGIPVLAHPLSLYLSWTKLEPVLQNFKERGIAGIEAFHPGARVTECLRLEEMARRNELFVTAGSDFHGEKVRADRHPGITCGGKKIENRFYYDELMPALEKARSSR